MKKIPTCSVVIQSTILEDIIKKCIVSFPSETGVFLHGLKHPTRKNVYEVTGYYEPDAVATTGSWSWKISQWVEAVKWAISPETRLVGMAHSHPWMKPYFTGIAQSRTDAEIQQRCNFDISLIFMLWYNKNEKEINWWLSAWHVTSSFPFKIFISKNGDVYSLSEWMRSHRTGIWKVAKNYGE